jgi:hypothetical protein
VEFLPARVIEVKTARPINRMANTAPTTMFLAIEVLFMANVKNGLFRNTIVLPSP